MAGDMSLLTEPAPPPDNRGGYEQETGSRKRLLGITVALLSHALLIYGFTSGLGTKLVQKVQKTVNVSIIPEAKPPPPPPPPPPPVEIEADTRPKQAQQRAPTRAYVPKAEVQATQQSADTSSGVTSNVAEATAAVEAEAAVVPDAPPVKKADPV